MTIEWNETFRKAQQIVSVDGAANLVNAIGREIGLRHFRLNEVNLSLCGSITREGPAPLRSEAAGIFDDVFGGRTSVTVSRLRSSSLPFWWDEISGEGIANSTGHLDLLCCPVRYSHSANTLALFLGRKSRVGFQDMVYLQAAVTLMLERVLKLGILHRHMDNHIGETERTCLDMYSRGHSVSDIAQELDLTDQDVVTSMNEARSRLFANNISHAVAKAIRSGVI